MDKETENRISEFIEKIECQDCPFLYTAECKQHHENADCEEAVAEYRGEE